MSERRAPYTTRNLPRADGPTHPTSSRLATLDAENEALLRQSLERAEENSDLRQRLAALEAAARKVCDASEYPQGCGAAPGPIQRLAIKDLCKIISEEKTP